MKNNFYHGVLTALATFLTTFSVFAQNTAGCSDFRAYYIHGSHSAAPGGDGLYEVMLADGTATMNLL